jgi:RimJ/RimL family protein N-acetyltransferase
MKNKILKETTFEKITPEDSSKYRAVRLESLQEYPNHFGSTYKEQKQKQKLTFEQFIETSTPQCFIVGAFHTGTLIGICGFYSSNEGRYKHRGEIIQLYVQPKYQNYKIGFNLLKATISKAFEIEALEQIELEVITRIQSANKIYEKIGFQEYGLLKNFLKNDKTYCNKRLMVLHRHSHLT